MPLPHPHGDASGQIAHNANKDLGDTPTSTGGKFIGNGEEAQSAIANRASWALSENIDFLYQILLKDIAIPTVSNFTSTGQSQHQLVGDVWTGDGTYPGVALTSELIGCKTLFKVLDDQDEPLMDGANEVRVNIVSSDGVPTTPGDVGDVYQSEFVTTPYLHFVTVNAAGNIVLDPYTIPAATIVNVVVGLKGSFESMPADTLIKLLSFSRG